MTDLYRKEIETTEYVFVGLKCVNCGRSYGTHFKSDNACTEFEIVTEFFNVEKPRIRQNSFRAGKYNDRPIPKRD